MTDPTDRLAAALADRYRIERELGAGGMATVYLAEDLKHHREVAIKVLRPELAAVLGADRFVQEIQTTAQLQHPHILPLFDSGEADGFLFYVMPYVEGETLRNKLDRETQLSIDEAVRITTEVADALDYAHRHGVVHRDIKPENILLHDGRPMVADFGIALALSAAAGGRMTETGMSLGTPHYMSPEQATADKDIGPRSDVYSLASVLYEMLAGQPPHLGGSAQQIIMKIIAEPVDPVTRYRKSAPPNLAAALAKALEKLPADRFESAKAFAEALGDPAFQHVTVASAVAVHPTRGGGRPLAAVWLPWIVAAAALAVAAWSLMRPAAPPPTPPAVRMVLSGFDVGAAAGGGRRIAISRDGRTLVAGGPDSMLYVRRSDDTTFRPIPGTRNARSPSISPDGAWIVFQQGQGLAKVLLTGGPVLPVADAGSHADWYAPDSILYMGPSGLSIVGAAGGVPRLVSGDTVRGGRPFMLPDRRGVLYEGGGGVKVLDLKTGKNAMLEPGGSNPRYLPTGDLLYGDRNRQAVFAVPFDLKTLQVTGTPVPVLPSVLIWSGGAVQLTVSDNGTLVYVGGSGTANAGSGNRVIWIDTAGAVTPLPVAPGFASFPRVSHDGARIAYVDTGATFVYNLTTGARTEVDSEASVPLWLPSDSGLYVSARHRGWLGVPVNRPGKPVTLATEITGPMVGISPDGKWVVSANFVGRTAPDIYIAPTDSLPLHPRPYLRADWSETQPVISPDGHWLAYVSNQSDTDEVYIRSFPVPGPAVRVSTGGGEAPMWAPHGAALYYASPKAMYRATLRLGSGDSILGRKRLFPLPTGVPVVSRGVRQIDISPDGSRFLATLLPALEPADTSATSRPAGIGTTIVVVNWFSELKAAMGAAGR